MARGCGKPTLQSESLSRKPVACVSFVALASPQFSVSCHLDFFLIPPLPPSRGLPSAFPAAGAVSLSLTSDRTLVLHGGLANGLQSSGQALGQSGLSCRPPGAPGAAAGCWLPFTQHARHSCLLSPQAPFLSPERPLLPHLATYTSSPLLLHFLLSPRGARSSAGTGLTPFFMSLVPQGTASEPGRHSGNLAGGTDAAARFSRAGTPSQELFHSQVLAGGGAVVQSACASGAAALCLGSRDGCEAGCPRLYARRSGASASSPHASFSLPGMVFLVFCGWGHKQGAIDCLVTLANPVVAPAGLAACVW